MRGRVAKNLRKMARLIMPDGTESLQKHIYQRLKADHYARKKR